MPLCEECKHCKQCKQCSSVQAVYAAVLPPSLVVFFCVDLIFQLYQVIKLLEAIEDNKTIRDNSEETMDLVVQMPNKD